MMRFGVGGLGLGVWGWRGGGGEVLEYWEGGVWGVSGGLVRGIGLVVV